MNRMRPGRHGLHDSELRRVSVSHSQAGAHFTTEGEVMFSVQQKRDISTAVQRILRETRHPELPKAEIEFSLKVLGESVASWAHIKNNKAVPNPSVNPWNELQDPVKQPKKKVTGWAYNRGGAFHAIIILSAPSRKAACEKFEHYGYHVDSPEDIKSVTIIQGHEAFPDVPEYDWENAEGCE